MMSDLRRLQLVQLIILNEVKRICDKYNIKYYLVGGSMIGAVRHKGFIPWDDDIDIGLLRRDYDKFLEVCTSELSEEFFLQTKETDTEYALPWAKLQINGTRCIDKSVEETNVRTGIDIDIFPYDNISTIPFVVWVHSNICWMLRGLYCIKCNYILLNREKSLKKEVGMKICNILAIFISKKTLSKIMDIIFKRYSNKKTKYVMNLASPYNYRKEIVPRRWLEDTILVQFEGEEQPIPIGYHEYLTQLFGDYMTLPDKNKRIQHAIIELDFGKYASITEDALK